MLVDDKIAIVGPILRSLLASGQESVSVGYSGRCQCPDGCVNVAIDDYDDTEALIDLLSQAVGSKGTQLGCVQVQGLGCFAVERWDRPGRVAGKISIVTGAAQGVGLEIARQMAGEGALVALGDINESGAAAAADKICRDMGCPCAIGLAVNVADGDSLKGMVAAVARRWGAADVLVANAGVLRAASVKTQAVEDFDFVTSVNYRGYFLSAQAVAPMMALQHRANPDVTTDIIQINSKSGLEGSKCNGAYAGSKFGGIGLTQSFALELVADGIKVNSICPGNFFDGPLWSDPENGLFVQYLRTKKVPGAKSVEDVRRAYEKKVPMGRGCDVSDVTRAIYYLIEQQYETGQALAVTGGQVMLK